MIEDVCEREFIKPLLKFIVGENHISEGLKCLRSIARAVQRDATYMKIN